MSATRDGTPASSTLPSFSCLLVEDDTAFAAIVQEVIRRQGGQPTHCATLADARSATERQSFDLVLLDNHLPDGKAYDFFDLLSRRNPDAPIIMITGLPDLSEAIALTRNGLFDYLTKPIDTDAFTACLQRARLRMRPAATPGIDEIRFGQSPAMRTVLQQLQQAARHPSATVLLTGESGVGKDVAARALHRLSYGEQADAAPYVALNCAAVPGDMFEAEVFGAERGAYTGADRRRPGLAATAQGGTLFLDEIGEVPLPTQAKLLRFLESREFRALGGGTVQTFTGRLVAATNKNLREEVQAGRFREDLLFRIEVFTVEIPPLRQRREDIPALAEQLIAQLARKYDRRTPVLRAEDLAALQRHEFPGNVRELRNILERALLRTPDDVNWLNIDPLWINPRPSSTSIRPTATQTSTPTLAPNQAKPAAHDVSNDPLPLERAGLSPIESQEYRLIGATLAECNGGIRRAAAKLGLSPQALLRRLEKWPELRPNTE